MRKRWYRSLACRNLAGCLIWKLKIQWPQTPSHTTLLSHSVAVFSLYEAAQRTRREHNAYCCWLPIMMHNPVAAQEYNTNMSGLWFGHNLHGYNSLSTGSRLSRARRLHYNDWPCASDSLFQASVAQSPGPLSRQYAILILLSASRQSLRKHPPPRPAPPIANNLTSTSSIPSNPLPFSLNYFCIIQAFPMEINTGAIH